VGVVCLAVCVLLSAGCGRRSNREAKAEEGSAAVPVEAGTVTAGDIASYFTGNTTLEAVDETQVVAKVGGVVKAILVEEGDYVNAGQTLAKLDDEKLAVQMDQATADLQKLESDFQRADELFGKNLISEQEFQRAKFEYDGQKAAYGLCKLDLEYTAIKSPLSGVVSERLIKSGNMIVPNQATFRVTDLDPLLAVLHVPERHAGKLQAGQPASLAVDALPGAEFQGRVERISPVVDPSTGTVKVTVEVRDATRRLKPGMLARVSVTHDVHPMTTLAPRDAVIEEDNQSSVFVVRAGTAYRQTIQTGFVNTTHIEILNGLARGDTVVTTGKGGLRDSAKVEIVPGADLR
ncbi:MAG: efflux RND transporter periplasmic adaptor subunit, partial [bacterium]